jgi:hypothetical protein
MEHLKVLLFTPSASRMNPPSPADCTWCLRTTLSSVVRSIKSNFVNTLSRKANKRVSSPSPLSSPPLTSKHQRLMVMPPATSTFLPLQSSTTSSLTQSSWGHDTNQAIQDVLYGEETESSFETGPILLTSNLGLRCLLTPNILQLQEQDKLVIVLCPVSCLLPVYKGFIHQDVCQTNRFLSQPLWLELVNETLLKWHQF